MRLPKKKILGVVLTMAVLLISSHALADQQPQGEQPADAKRELSDAVPDLADIIPLATKLSGRLAALENAVEGGLEDAAVEEQYAETEANLRSLDGQFQLLKDSKDASYNKFVKLKTAIEQENKSFEKISQPLGQEITQLGAWRSEWLAERKNWNEWQSSLLKEGEIDQLKTTFAKANNTIDTALNLVLPQLEAMLAAQEKAARIQTKIDAIAADLDGLILAERRDVLVDASPPMFSSRYFSQFGTELRHAVRNGLDAIAWPDSRFFAQEGWILLLQGFLVLVVIIAVYRNRPVLNDSKRWRFLAARPFSAGLFFGVLATLFLYEYEGVPATWELAYTIVGGLCCARLIGCLVDASWKRQFVYGLMIFLILTRLMYVVSLPLPLLRLYVVLTALVGLFFCLRWAGESVRQNDARLYAWSLRLEASLFVVIIIAEIWGKGGLAQYLFYSMIRSIATLLTYMLFMHMIRGGLEWVFHDSLLRRAAVLQSDADAIIRRVARFTDVVMGVLLLSAFLKIWRVYDNLEGALKGLLAFGFNLGSQRISVGLVIASVGIIYGAFFVSWIIQKLLMDEVFVRRRVETGVRLSIGRLVHYVLVVVGFSLALLALGFEFTKLTIMVSALGVGIGFGLQSVVNNFVSGLILLFERPVRVGDYIELGGKWAEVKNIGLRATTLQTFDQADVIVPNADLVTNPVTNWTLSNRRVRATVPVGVAYGSDVTLVMEKLLACAKASPKVSNTPASQVLFLKFGENSLDFELRAWVWDAEERLRVISELHQAIDRSFREAKIEIAFPQRDLHLRSLDESVILRPPEPTG
jgi:small-conductance mechanosensitive channel